MNIKMNEVTTTAANIGPGQFCVLTMVNEDHIGERLLQKKLINRKGKHYGSKDK